MLYAEKVDDLRRRLEFFRERLSAEDADVNVGQNLTVTKIDDSVREFDIILGNLDKIVISELERICYWDEIENILILIIENRNGIDLVERKQYAIDLINLGRMEKWISISDYLRGCLRCNLAEQMLLCGWNEDSRLMHINNYTGRCGVNNYQAQLINTEFAKSLIRRDEAVYTALAKAQIEYLKYKAKHDEDLRFEREKNKMNGMIGTVANELKISDEKNDIDYRELEKRFIENNNLVRLIRDSKPVIYYWDCEKKVYEIFETKITILTALNTFAYDEYGEDIEISTTKLESSVNRMLHKSVPLLEGNEKVKFGTAKQVFFRDGYYGLDDRGLYKINTKNYFHKFCLPYLIATYDFTLFNLKLDFDKIVGYIFDEDMTKIILLYQIIGAILSDVALKNVFVFQGVSNSGKSTLSHIIMNLLDDNDVKFIGSMNEINTTKCSPYEGRIKLLYVDDAPNEKWSDATVSYLKTRSRGIMKKGETLFKILLCTNYPIYYKTEDGRDESMDSRIVVLPFEKDLKSATINNGETMEFVDYMHSEKFEEEKVHIAVKSLYYFREVLNNNCEFVHRYPINSCVVGSKVNMNIFNDKNDDVIIDVTDYTIINTSKNISEKNSKLIEWLRENFEITENEYLMAEQVFDYIREVMPETHGRIHDVGKVVRSVFGDKVDFRRNGKTWYKIKLKSR